MEAILEWATSDSRMQGCNLIPRDPWRSDYSLAVEHGELVITSFGGDKRSGGIGDDADLVSVGGRRVSHAASREP